jgi:DNA polymerase-1
VLDLLTLTGDAIDNVPGVAKVGRKPPPNGSCSTERSTNVIAHAGDIGGVVGQNLRDRARLAAAGQAPPDSPPRLRARRQVADLTLGEPADATSARAYERFEFKSWLGEFARGERETHVAAKPRDAEPQAAARSAAARRGSRAARRIRDGADAGALAALA